MTTVLHIVTEKEALEAALGAASPDDAIVLLADGSYALPLLTDNLGQRHVYAMQPDTEARGLLGKLPAQVKMISYEKLVDLTLTYERSITWH